MRARAWWMLGGLVAASVPPIKAAAMAMVVLSAAKTEAASAAPRMPARSGTGPRPNRPRESCRRRTPTNSRPPLVAAPWDAPLLQNRRAAKRQTTCAQQARQTPRHRGESRWPNETAASTGLSGHVQLPTARPGIHLPTWPAASPTALAVSGVDMPGRCGFSQSMMVCQISMVFHSICLAGL